MKKVKSPQLQSDFPLSNSKICKFQEPNSSTTPISNNCGDQNIITRFKKNAQICGICYISIEKQVNNTIIIF